MVFKNRFFLFFSLLSLIILYFFIKETRNVLKTPISAWSKPVQADCAVVLTGSEGRIQKGIDLLSQKRVKKLIISGVYKGSTFFEIFPQWPFYNDVDEADILLEKRSLTTYGNAKQSLPFIEALNCRDIVLITTSLHMHRAYNIFVETLPSHIKIYTYATFSGDIKPNFWPTSIEVIKSLFYSIWAY